MAQLVYSTINSGYASTQAYLAMMRVCVGCKSQKPKETFKMFEQQELCADCREELQEERDVDCREELQEEREDGSIDRK